MSRGAKRLFWYWYCRLFNRDQAWYWTKEWQAGERRADEDIRAGRVYTFVNTDDFVAWLSDSDSTSSTYRVIPNNTTSSRDE